MTTPGVLSETMICSTLDLRGRHTPSVMSLRQASITSCLVFPSDPTLSTCFRIDLRLSHSVGVVCKITKQKREPLFVFSINGPKQNARSLLTPVSDPAFYALSHGSKHFLLHGSSNNHLFQRFWLAEKRILKRLFEAKKCRFSGNQLTSWLLKKDPN